MDVGATDPADTHGEPPPPQPLPQAGAYAAYLPHSLGGSGRCRLNGFEMGCGWIGSKLATGMIQPVPELAYRYDPRQPTQNKPSGLEVRGPNPFDQFVLSAGGASGFTFPMLPNPFDLDVIRTFTNEPYLNVYWMPNPLFSLPQNTPMKTPEQQRCDDKLAHIFGGDGAVAAGNGFEPKGGKDPLYDGTFRGNGQDISDRAMHLYGSGDKTVTTGVYLPGKITSLYPNPQTVIEYKGGSFVAFYSKLNGLKNVSLIVTHLADFTRNSHDVNGEGSRYIGTTGGWVEKAKTTFMPTLNSFRDKLSASTQPRR